MKAKTKRVPEIEPYQAENKEFSWRLRGANNQIMATPAETFKRRNYVNKSVIKVATALLIALDKNQVFAVLEELCKQYKKVTNGK